MTDSDGLFYLAQIDEMDLNLSNHRENKLRYFIYQHNRYIWLSDQGAFVNVLALNEKLTICMLMENLTGLNKRQQNELYVFEIHTKFTSYSNFFIYIFLCFRLKLYGGNSVEVKVMSYWTIFINEVFNPFYLFQVFSIVLWSLDEYYQYATCVFILSTASCVTALCQTKQVIQVVPYSSEKGDRK